MSTPPGQPIARKPYQQTVDAVLADLGTDGRVGLSEAEARARLERGGRNELTGEKPAPGWRKFVAQFRDVLVILLIIAAAVSAALWWFERGAALPYEALSISAIGRFVSIGPSKSGFLSVHRNSS